MMESEWEMFTTAAPYLFIAIPISYLILGLAVFLFINQVRIYYGDIRNK